MSGNSAKLRGVARGGGVPAGTGSATGRAISDELRRLQSQRGGSLDADGIVAGLVSGLSCLLAGGYFVSLSRTRDGRSIRLSVKDGTDWIELYTDDPDHAEELSSQIAASFAL